MSVALPQHLHRVRRIAVALLIAVRKNVTVQSLVSLPALLKGQLPSAPNLLIYLINHEDKLRRSGKIVGKGGRGCLLPCYFPDSLQGKLISFSDDCILNHVSHPFSQPLSPMITMHTQKTTHRPLTPMLIFAIR